MKKLFYLFLLLPFTMMISCNKDDDFSPVDVTISLSGVTQVNDNFYAVAGENVSCANIQAQSIDGKNTAISNVAFYLNGNLIPYTPYDPFFTLNTEGMAAGTYTISFAANLMQEGSSLKVFAGSFPLTIVESEEDLPAGAPEIGTYSITLNISE